MVTVLKGGDLFLATAVVRMIFRNDISSLLLRNQETVTLGKILQTLRFPGSAVFHRRVEDFRLRVGVYTMLHSYTYATPCVCL